MKKLTREEQRASDLITSMAAAQDKAMHGRPVASFSYWKGYENGLRAAVRAIQTGETEEASDGEV